MAASMSRRWRIRFQLVSRAERRVAIVESAVKSSEATVVEEERSRGGAALAESTTFVLGPAGCETGALLPNVLKEGRDKLSISTGVSPVRSILVGFSLGIHQSNSRSFRSAFKSIPSCDMGQ